MRGKDSVIVVTWMLADDVLDTGIRADDGVDHAALLEGIMVEHADNSEQVESSENPNSEGVHDAGEHEVFDGMRGDGPLDGPSNGPGDRRE